MGEMADDALDQMWDPELDEFTGEPTGSECGYVGYYREPAMKTCRYCGAAGLVWIGTDEGWRLSADGKVPHVCRQFLLARGD